MQYRIENNKVTHFGEWNWRDNFPFDGIELTDEPFTMNDFWMWELINNEWIKHEEPDIDSDSV